MSLRASNILLPTDIIISEKELASIIADLEFFQTNFLELVDVSIESSGKSDINILENWLRYNYINLRNILSKDARHQYLMNVAFSQQPRG